MFGTARSIIASMVRRASRRDFRRTSKSRASASRPRSRASSSTLRSATRTRSLMDIPDGIKITVTEQTKLQGRGRGQAARGRRDRRNPQLLPAGALQGQGRPHRRRARPPQGRQDRRLSDVRSRTRNHFSGYHPMNTIRKANLLQKRRWRIRKKVNGTAARPRLSRALQRQAHLRPGDQRRRRQDARVSLQPRSPSCASRSSPPTSPGRRPWATPSPPRRRPPGSPRSCSTAAAPVITARSRHSPTPPAKVASILRNA